MKPRVRLFRRGGKSKGGKKDSKGPKEPNAPLVDDNQLQADEERLKNAELGPVSQPEEQNQDSGSNTNPVSEGSNSNQDVETGNSKQDVVTLGNQKPNVATIAVVNPIPAVAPGNSNQGGNSNVAPIAPVNPIPAGAPGNSNQGGNPKQKDDPVDTANPVQPIEPENSNQGENPKINDIINAAINPIQGTLPTATEHKVPQGQENGNNRPNHSGPKPDANQSDAPAPTQNLGLSSIPPDATQSPAPDTKESPDEKHNEKQKDADGDTEKPKDEKANEEKHKSKENKKQIEDEYEDDSDPERVSGNNVDQAKPSDRPRPPPNVQIQRQIMIPGVITRLKPSYQIQNAIQLPRLSDVPSNVDVESTSDQPYISSDNAKISYGQLNTQNSILGIVCCVLVIVFIFVAVTHRKIKKNANRRHPSVVLYDNPRVSRLFSAKTR